MRFVWPRDFQLFIRECIKPLKNKKQFDVSSIGSSNACRSCSNSGVNVAYHDTSVFDRARTRRGSSVATSILPRMFSIRSRGVGGPRPRTCFSLADASARWRCATCRAALFQVPSWPIWMVAPIGDPLQNIQGVLARKVFSLSSISSEPGQHQHFGHVGSGVNERANFILREDLAIVALHDVANVFEHSSADGVAGYGAESDRIRVATPEHHFTKDEMLNPRPSLDQSLPCNHWKRRCGAALLESS